MPHRAQSVQDAAAGIVDLAELMVEAGRDRHSVAVDRQVQAGIVAEASPRRLALCDGAAKEKGGMGRPIETPAERFNACVASTG
jgi:hypothetical protein